METWPALALPRRQFVMSLQGLLPSSQRRQTLHFPWWKRQRPPPPRPSVSASYYSHQQRNDRNRREDINRGEYQHQSRATGTVGHTFDSWALSMIERTALVAPDTTLAVAEALETEVMQKC